MMSWPDFKYKQIIVHRVLNRGEKLRFRADNIVILDADDKVVVQHSCHRLFALFIIGELSMTSVLMRNAVKFGFPIILMNTNLKIISRINCAAEGNTTLRKYQYGCEERRLQIAKLLIRGKINNQIQLLKDLRRLADGDKVALDYLQGLNIELAQDSYELMGLEGCASKMFFSAYFRPLGWKRREPRCKRDIYNLLMDIGYTYLFQFIEAMLSLYGFDLYCGVLHTFFYQRKSLVCDIVEPFRCIIDRRIRKAYNLDQIDEKDFAFSNGAYSLGWDKQEKYTRLFMKDILTRKEEIFKFCHTYYRWFMRGGQGVAFPVFNI